MYYISSPIDFELGLEQHIYRIREEDGLVSNVVKITKMNGNSLQKDYQFAVNVIHDNGPYTAELGKSQ